MVAAHDLVQNKAVFHPRHKAVGNNEIVYAPTNVLFARLANLAPPRVFYLVGVERAEGIFEADIEQI